MDIVTLLDRIEKEFFRRLEKKTGWGKLEIQREYSEAIKNVMITTYAVVMKDAGKKGDS
jgi:hypothetical protein